MATTEKRLIDANALLDEIRKSKDGHNHTECEILMNHHMEHDVFMDLVDLAPTVDAVEVVHGQWEEADDMDGVVCSVCGEDFCTIINETDRFKRCPNCGTVMVGGN